MRNQYQLYPDYKAEIKEIEDKGISEELIKKIIEKHANNAEYNKSLYNRYKCIDGYVPITTREPRFKMKSVNGKTPKQINNKINNDFFSEITDFKVGYFAGKPIAYNYSRTDESEEDTGGIEAVEIAKKSLSDFVTRNNMYDMDMEATKHASICGYAGRLLYHDEDGMERVLIIPAYEAIILSNTTIMEPEYAIRYFATEDINQNEYWVVEFYDANEIRTYEGQLSSLELVKTEMNLYGYCPLQGIPNNNELLGDAEGVLTEIDAYDRVVSDCSNQIEGQVHSKEIYENVNISEEEIAMANYTGALSFFNGNGNGKIYNLEKNINDGFVEHHLERLTENIYRFSRTPNLNDDAFGNATGVALKFKLTGLETKCGMFQAKMASAGVYMFKLLASAWAKRQITIDPLQCYMDFKRNFPLDIEGEARAAQQLIAAGLPEEVAYSLAISAIDDIDYVMQLIENKKQNIPSLEDRIKEDEDLQDDEDDLEDDDIEDDEDEDELKNAKREKK